MKNKLRFSQRSIIALLVINAAILAFAGILMNGYAVGAAAAFIGCWTFYIAYAIPPTKHLNMDLRCLALVLLSGILGSALLWIGCHISIGIEICSTNEFRGAIFFLFYNLSIFALVLWLFGRLPALIKNR